MKSQLIITSLLFFLATSAFAQYVPELDVRGTDDVSDGGELQIATPGETNFLRLFSGRQGDPSPHLYFSNQDTFRIANGAEDFTQFIERLGVFPDGSIRIGNLAGSGERLVSVDATGMLKASTPPGSSFAARLSSDTTIQNSSEATLIDWSTSHDDGGNFDPVAGIYTVPEDGVYLFKVRYSWKRDLMDLDNAPVITRFKINGNTAPLGQNTERVTIRSNYGEDTNFSLLDRFESGDQISVTTIAITGGPTILLRGDLGAGSTSISGSRIN